MEVKKLVKLKYEDLACYTDNFSESNYLSHFQFGKLYRGKIVCDNHTLNVMVKIWEVSEIYFYSDGDNQGRLMDYNPKLCDFGLISGGIFEDRTIYVGHYVLGSYGYIDVDSYYKGEFTVKQDVYAFGVILLNLISKRAYEVEGRGKPDEVYDWAWKEFSEFIKRGDLKNKLSLVHQSLRDDPDFVAVDGEKITWLALKCTESDINQRPTMKQVMRTLLKLRQVNRNVDFFGLKE